MTGNGNELLGRDDPSEAHGAALGIGGFRGWWIWRHRRQLRRDVDAVPAGTWRGARNVTLWFAGLLGIIVAGSLLTPLPPLVWAGVAIVVMVGVGRWWDRRTERQGSRRGPFA